jgi:hypothetical protein
MSRRVIDIDGGAPSHRRSMRITDVFDEDDFYCIAT